MENQKTSHAALEKNVQASHTRLKRRRLALFGFGAGAGIALHWIATSLEHVLEKGWERLAHVLWGIPPQLALLGVALLAFACLSYIAYRFRDAVVGPKLAGFALASQQTRRCLIFLVSSEDFRTGLPRLNRIADANGALTGWTLDGAAYLNLADLRQISDPVARIETAINNAHAKPPWPWQQLLRGILPHTGAVRRIWLVGSSGSKGSLRELPRCREFLLHLLPEGVEVFIEGENIVSSEFTEAEAAKRCDEGVEFEDFQALESRLSKLIHRACSRPHNFHHRDIVIDATGGQKTTSIAAASVTLKSDVVFQYVQTGGDNDVLIYDVTYVSESSQSH